MCEEFIQSNSQKWVNESFCSFQMILHGKNMSSVYDVIDKSVLPTEYLPDDHTGPSAGSINQIVGNVYLCNVSYSPTPASEAWLLYFHTVWYMATKALDTGAFWKQNLRGDPNMTCGSH